MQIFVDSLGLCQLQSSPREQLASYEKQIILHLEHFTAGAFPESFQFWLYLSSWQPAQKDRGTHLQGEVLVLALSLKTLPFCNLFKWMINLEEQDNYLTVLRRSNLPCKYTDNGLKKTNNSKWDCSYLPARSVCPFAKALLGKQPTWALHICKGLEARGWEEAVNGR